MNNLLIISKIITTLFLILWIFIAYLLKYSGKEGYLFCSIIFILSFLPFIAAKITKKAANTYNWNNMFKTIISIILIIGFLLYAFGIGVFTLLGTFMFYISEAYVPKFAYEKELNKLKDRIGMEPLSHFPKKIPEQARNYQFKIEDAWDESEYTVSFKIDKLYRDKVINDFYNCCTVYIDKNHPHEHIPLHAMEAKDSDQFCYFTLKAVDNYYYYSGIAVNNDTDTIYYFYNK